MKPMLAAPAGKVVKLPVLLSPKMDGIRCLIIDGVACGRSLKPLPNRHVQKLLGRSALNGLDGELIVGDSTAKNVLQVTTSGVMSVYGEPKMTFWVFDDFTATGGFHQRLRVVQRRVKNQRACHDMPHYYVETHDDLDRYEENALDLGYEGVMLRSLDGPYKHGRSTVKEGYLLKVKRFIDGEARIIGFSQLLHNNNEPKRNELGHLERSNSKAGKMGAQLLGSFTVQDLKTGVEFDLGTGFTDEQRRLLWERADHLVGQVVKYKSQPTGVKDRPRFPVFLDFRHEVDM